MSNFLHFHWQCKQLNFTSIQNSLGHLILDAETFVVNNVANENDDPLAYIHTKGKLDITLKVALQKGHESKVIIHYQADNVDIAPTKFGMKAGYATEQSYLLKAAAISALGKYHDPALKDFISQAALSLSPRDVVAKAAKAALTNNQ